MLRRCLHCGTEVDAEASFCPSCGRPLSDEAQPPPPEPEPPATAESGLPPRDEEAPTAAWRSPSEEVGSAPPTASQAAAERAGARDTEPPITFSWPTRLSSWLIGVGAVVGAFAMFLPWRDAAAYTQAWGLASGVNILFFLVLLWVAATVFLARSVPHFAFERLALLAVSLIGLGIGLDRIGLAGGAIGALLFFLAMLAATIGVLLVELDADRPLRGPSR